MLGLDTNGEDPPPQKPVAIPWNSPKGSLSKAKNPTTSGGKADLSSIRSIHRNSRYMISKGGTVGSHFPSTSRAARCRSAISSRSIKTGSTKSATTRPSGTTPELREPNVSSATKAPMQPRVDTQLSLQRVNSKDSHRNKHFDTNETNVKVKSKRSFREFFHIRDGRSTEKVPTPAENKRSSLAFTGNTFAGRFRHSANLSKPDPVKASAAEELPHPDSEVKARKNDDDDHKGTPSGVAGSAPPATCSDKGMIVYNILDSVSSLPSHSPDRLRGLEIAEVCTIIQVRSIMLQELVLTIQIKQTLLNVVDAHKQARISAAKAKKHARHAELNAERATVELERMQKLCEPVFDHETVQAIKELVKCVGALGGEEQSSLSSGAAAPVQ